MTVSSPSVSIVLPCYNGARYLEGAIKSCQAQTLQDWELIIVDDASSDATPTIAQQAAQNDPHIQYVRNPKNRKLPGSLNVGFTLARGQWWTWTSDDNLYRPEALELMVAALKTSGADIVYADMDLINEEGEVTERRKHAEPEALAYCNCIGACFLHTPQVFQQLGGYNESLFLVEDWDFWLRAGSQFRFHHLAASPYEYRQHSGSLTAQRMSEIRALREKILRENLPKLKQTTPRTRASGWAALARLAAARGAWQVTFADLLQAGKGHPLTALRTLRTIWSSRTHQPTEHG